MHYVHVKFFISQSFMCSNQRQYQLITASEKQSANHEITLLNINTNCDTSHHLMIINHNYND